VVSKAPEKRDDQPRQVRVDEEEHATLVRGQRME
jgi:hypothetical protein